MTEVFTTNEHSSRDFVVITADLSRGAHYDEALHRQGLSDNTATKARVIATANSITKESSTTIYEARQALMLHTAKKHGFETVEGWKIDVERKKSEDAVRRALGDSAKVLAYAMSRAADLLEGMKGGES